MASKNWPQDPPSRKCADCNDKYKKTNEWLRFRPLRGVWICEFCRTIESND